MFREKLTAGITLVLLGLMAITFGAFGPAPVAQAEPKSPEWMEDVIRLHVIANSDREEDQIVKRAVRDAVLDEMTPLFKQAGSIEEATELIRAHADRLALVAESVLRRHGFTYTARAVYGRFSFPTKAYGNLLLPAGEYNALRIVLGSGTGRNWWCVLFPPLCFADWTTGVVLEPRPETEITESVRKAQKAAGALPAKKGTGKRTGGAGKDPSDVLKRQETSSKRLVVLDERAPREMKVRARFRLAEWAKALLSR